MSVRLRRLQADYESVRTLLRRHARIELEGVFGDPPDRYRFVLKVGSLRERLGHIERVREHRLEVVLPQGYPRDAPLCRMLTPVFHPNIAPHAVCIGDHWTAGESLDLMIQRVGEMLAFQSYNIKSPLNGRAAQWVEEHLDELPIDAEEFFVDAADAGLVVCSNCGEAGATVPCEQGHVLCADCTHSCPTCQRLLCLACGATLCQVCAA